MFFLFLFSSVLDTYHSHMIFVSELPSKIVGQGGTVDAQDLRVKALVKAGGPTKPPIIINCDEGGS